MTRAISDAAPPSPTVRSACHTETMGTPIGMLLVIGIVLLIIAIAGGTIVHPVLFALAIVALVLFFMGRRGATG